MKKLFLIFGFVVLLSSCKTNYQFCNKTEAEVVNVNGDVITVYVYDYGEYYEFFGNYYKVGDVVIVFMENDNIINVIHKRSFF